MKKQTFTRPVAKILRNDPDYSKAVNYTGTSYFNNPMTINLDELKFIIGCGTSDQIDLMQQSKSPLLYILSCNSGLDYAALMEIDLETNSTQETFLENVTRDYPKFFSYGKKFKHLLMTAYL